MNQDLLAHVASKSLRAKTLVIATGMTVKVSQKITEGEKERIQNFEGLVIATSGGKGIAATFTVRKIFSGVGVEKIFPLHGKNVVKIEIVKRAKVRRSKLYYARELRGKAARMSETHINEVIHDEESEKKAAADLKKKAEEAAAKAEAEKAPVEEKPAEAVETAEKPAEEKAEAAPEKEA